MESWSSPLEHHLKIPFSRATCQHNILPEQLDSREAKIYADKTSVSVYIIQKTQHGNHQVALWDLQLLNAREYCVDLTASEVFWSHITTALKPAYMNELQKSQCLGTQLRSICSVWWRPTGGYSTESCYSNFKNCFWLKQIWRPMQKPMFSMQCIHRDIQYSMKGGYLQLWMQYKHQGDEGASCPCPELSSFAVKWKHSIW